jgi:hypothetical protein
MSDLSVENVGFSLSWLDVVLRRQHRNRHVAAVDLVAGEDMTPELRPDRIEQPGRLSNPIAQRQAIEFEPFPGIDLALAIQRQVVAAQHGNQL